MSSSRLRDCQSGLFLSSVSVPLSVASTLGFQGRAEQAAPAKGGKICAAPGTNLRKQARRGHPRQGIDLEEEYLAVRRDDYIGTSGSAAPQRAVCLEADLVDARVLLFGKGSRKDVARTALRYVLRLVVVELSRGNDFDGPERLVIQDRALDLTTLDVLFHHHQARVARRIQGRLLELLRGPADVHSDRGPLARRLDHHRKFEREFRYRSAGGLPVPRRDLPGSGNAVSGEYLLGEDLFHSHRRGEDPRAGVGNEHRLQ